MPNPLARGLHVRTRSRAAENAGHGPEFEGSPAPGRSWPTSDAAPQGHRRDDDFRQVRGPPRISVDAVLAMSSELRSLAPASRLHRCHFRNAINWRAEETGMASATTRNLDDDVKTRLRVRAVGPRPTEASHTRRDARATRLLLSRPGCISWTPMSRPISCGLPQLPPSRRGSRSGMRERYI